MKIIIVNSRPGEVVIEDRRYKSAAPTKISGPYSVPYQLGAAALHDFAERLAVDGTEQFNRDEAFIKEMKAAGIEA